jgi:DNA polymerase-3 subunit gamma/tau
MNPEDGNPCLKCEACLETEKGATDISEIDAASNNGVDDVRILREQTHYAPVSLKYRVFIIDEVHMLSAGAFNALLKTLEEPPAHVVFILATTENHKVPATILSRCQRFEFKRVNMRDCAAALKNAAESENVSITDDAAELIARLSDGGMRDALSLLETCISHDNEITGKVVREAAGVAGSEHVFGISETILAQNPANALKIINYLHEQSKDMGRFLGEIIGHYRNLMLLKLMPDETDLISWLPEETGDYRRFAEKYELPGIMKCLNTLEEYYERISRSRDKKLVAELCVIEMCAGRDARTSSNTGDVPQAEPKQLNSVPMTRQELDGAPMTRQELDGVPGASRPTAVSFQEPELPPEPPDRVPMTRQELDGAPLTRQELDGVPGASRPTAELPPEPVVLAPGWGDILQTDKITQFKNTLKLKGIEVKER